MCLRSSPMRPSIRCHERAFGDPDPTPIFAGSKAAHALVVAEQLQSSNQVYQRALDKFGFIEAWAKPNAERRTPNAERRTPNAKRQTPNAHPRSRNPKRSTPTAN